MIFVHRFYEWIPFFTLDNSGQYELEGKLMSCPDPVNGDVILHDLVIEKITSIEDFSDKTNVVDHDWFWDQLERELI